MYVLHYYPGNASMAPHMMLRQGGLPHRLELVDRSNNAQKAPAYLKLNPNGRIPTFQDGETVMYEAAAICLYLSEKHPELNLAPAPGTPLRPEFLKWLFWATNTLQPELLTYHYTEKHVTNPDEIPGVKARSVERLAGMYSQLDQTLADGREWFLGQQTTLLDFYLFMLGRWGRMLDNPPRDYPHLGPYLVRLTDLPVVSETLEVEGLKRPWI